MRVLIGYKDKDMYNYLIIESEKSIVSWKTELYDKGKEWFKNKITQKCSCNEILELDWDTSLILDLCWMRCMNKNCYKLPYKLRDNKLP